MWPGRGWFGRGAWWGGGWGRGRGNPYPFCRFNPALPRRWWAYGSAYYPRMARGMYPSRGIGVMRRPYSAAPWGYPWR